MQIKKLWEPLEKVKKVSFKTIHAFNFTMTVLFLPVLVSKKDTRTEKDVPLIAVSHKFTYILKKDTKNDFFCDVGLPTLYWDCMPVKSGLLM